MISGIIVIDKEPGFTSHDVVAKMRGICGQKKIGHTGTLDPGATGVLPVCLGSGTKLCDMLTDSDKEYVAELLLGVRTDTQDITGTVLSDPWGILGDGRTAETIFRETGPTETEVRKACEAFVGEYMQIPPMYSALKVNGKKLYELARAGREVERKARPVTIHELEILEISLPVVTIRVSCSRGTYIRTLCADIGERLGCGGTMKSLRRTRAGGFTLEDAITLEELQQMRDRGRLREAVRPVDSVFGESPSLHVGRDWTGLLLNGNAILPGQTREGVVYTPGRWVRFYDEEEGFAGIYAFDEGKKLYKPVKMFLEQENTVRKG